MKQRVPDKDEDQDLQRGCVKGLSSTLNKEDTTDHSRWTKLIKISDDQDGCEWVNISSGTGPSG